MFLGAAAGLMARGICFRASTWRRRWRSASEPAVAAVLELPLAGAVLGVIFTASAGPGVAPLIIVGVVVAYLTKLALSARWPAVTT